MSNHTKTSIQNQLRNQALGWNYIYKCPAVNWQGDTDDKSGKERMFEVFAQWILDNFNDFTQGITKYHRESGNSRSIDKNRPYYTASHTQSADADIPADKCVREKRIARKLFEYCQSHDNAVNWDIGNVVDFEIPLAAKEGDPVGKVDLVSIRGDVLFLLELKKPESKETMLRCILEAYTYYLSIGSPNKFLQSFKDPKTGNSPTSIVIAPLVFANNSKNGQHASPWRNITDKKAPPKTLLRLITKIREVVPLEIMYIDTNKMDENCALGNMDIRTWSIHRYDV
jgi:hypothetical protein